MGLYSGGLFYFNNLKKVLVLKASFVILTPGAIFKVLRYIYSLLKFKNKCKMLDISIEPIFISYENDTALFSGFSDDVLRHFEW